MELRRPGRGHRHRGSPRTATDQGDRRSRTSSRALLHRPTRPASISVPGVATIRGAPILARLGDPARFGSLAGVLSFSGLVPPLNASGINGHHGGPTKSGDAPLREALFMAADGPAASTRPWPPATSSSCSRGQTPQLRPLQHLGHPAHPHRRVLACRHPYQIRDTDGTPLTTVQGRAIIAQRYRVSEELRARRRTSHTKTGTSLASTRSRQALRHRPVRLHHATATRRGPA